MGDLLLPPPLAFLNVEERHWRNDLGLPNQRRWLNHRNSVTNTTVSFPPPKRIVTQGRSDCHKSLLQGLFLLRFTFPVRQTKRTREQTRVEPASPLVIGCIPRLIVQLEII